MGSGLTLWWLTCNRHGRLHGVVSVEAASLTSACVGVADNALDKGVRSLRAMNLMTSVRDGFSPVMSA
jgi:hypothetical protein